MMKVNSNELLKSRIGFILLSAGCAIGLGNVWRFPYVVGKYGGGVFLLFYLIFLAILGFPCMVTELAIGRGGRSYLGDCYRKLAGENRKYAWHYFGSFAFIGNLILLMFYSVVTGWLLNYFFNYLKGGVVVSSNEFKSLFGELIANPGGMIFWTAIGILLSTLVCALDIQKGLERVTKILMMGLFVTMLFLVVNVLMAKGSMTGVKFLFVPNWGAVKENGLWTIIYEAMNQAFFTLSIGIGSLGVFASYIPKEKSLAQESVIIIVLDTFVAICSGLIIFPCCFVHNVSPDSGPSLIFITLPEVFRQMKHCQFWGAVFFFFISVAALTTLFAVTENLTAFCVRKWGLKRYKASLIVGVTLFICSLPCVFGFNIWKDFQPLGDGTNVLSLEDFIVSNNLLPFGALLAVLFSTSRFGWGMENFLKEANMGTGMRFTRWMALYAKFVLPIIILLIWILGIYFQCAG